MTDPTQRNHSADPDFDGLVSEIHACRICTARFAATATAHTPKPVPWLSSTASILLAGQAPGARVHASGIPFDDPSGDRLRDWLGVDRDAFYDLNKFAVLPMAFCFPGYDAKGSDLPPPAICAKTWRSRTLEAMPNIRLTLLIGGYAQRWHLGKPHRSVTETVQTWRDQPHALLPLPHPSWRNQGWIRRNPWFETELLPELRHRVSIALTGG